MSKLAFYEQLSDALCKDTYIKRRDISNHLLSDYRCKVLEQYKSIPQEEMTPDKVRGMLYLLANAENNLGFQDDSTIQDESYLGDDDGCTADMLEDYAKHIKNYMYSYKDEATAIDPRINPDEVHKGPMAQDIEQVAPDCVKDKAGTKVVDGSRLALVNAGVIGELARRLLDLEEKLDVR